MIISNGLLSHSIAKNNVADFMHDSPTTIFSFFIFTFVGIVVVDNRIYRYFCSFVPLFWLLSATKCRMCLARLDPLMTCELCCR